MPLPSAFEKKNVRDSKYESDVSETYLESHRLYKILSDHFCAFKYTKMIAAEISVIAVKLDFCCITDTCKNKAIQ